MKKQLLIIGGGYAGFWSAISAVRQSRAVKVREAVDITLVNPDNFVTIRAPFQKPFLESRHFELSKYFRPLGIHQITGLVEIIDSPGNLATISTRQGIRKLNFDYIILAAGSSLKLPDVPGIAHAFTVDTIQHAALLEDHINALRAANFQDQGARTFIVVGSGGRGLGTVIGLKQRLQKIRSYHPGYPFDFRIILLEAGNEVAPGYSAPCRKYTLEALTENNIEIILNDRVNIIGPASALLAGGTRIETRTVIWTEGVVASSLTRFFEAMKDDRDRLCVDQYFKVPGYANVIAAGSIVFFGPGKESSVMDSQYAQFEGRWAGHNAINDLFAFPLKAYLESYGSPCVDLGIPRVANDDDWQGAIFKKAYEVRTIEQHINSVTVYPWQDVEETVRSSFPHLPRL